MYPLSGVVSVAICAFACFLHVQYHSASSLSGSVPPAASNPPPAAPLSAPSRPTIHPSGQQRERPTDRHGIDREEGGNVERQQTTDRVANDSPHDPNAAPRVDHT